MAPAHPRGWVAGCFFLFFFSSSFLFRRKEAKENQLRNSCFSLLLLFSPAYCTKRAVPMRAVRFLCHGQDAPGTCLLPSIPCPALSFISFLQERPWALLPYRLKIEAKENQLRNSCFSLLSLFSPAYCTKRAVPMRAVRFLCHGQDAPGKGLLPSIPCPALSFISFLQEKKTSPFLK